MSIPVILDTDIGMDIDDTWALGLLLKCPELDVKLITTNTDNTEYKANLVAKFLERVNRTDIPIGIGPKENDTTGNLAEWVDDYDLSKYPGIIHENGVDTIINTILESPDPVKIIAIGPLGNIANALNQNPLITKNASFVGMHGSIRIGYRGNPNPSIEYNVLRDVGACQKVFNAQWEKTITPLDTCGNIVLSGERFKHILESNDSIAKTIMKNYQIWAGKNLKTTHRKSSILFDTVAIYLAFSEELINIEDLNIQVEDYGFTKISEVGSMIRCATSWKDVEAFKDLMVDRLVT